MRATLAQVAELGRGQVRDVQRRGLDLRCGERRGPALGLGEVAGPVIGQVDREALDLQVAERSNGGRELVAVEAVARHRRLALDDDAAVGVIGGEGSDVLDAADGVDDAGVVARRSPSNGRHGESIMTSPEKVSSAPGTSAYVPTAIVLTPRSAASRGEQVAAEAIAVALDDRDDAGRRLGQRTESAAPTLSIDAELERHSHRLFMYWMKPR